jgi:hypothetical protein
LSINAYLHGGIFGLAACPSLSDPIGVSAPPPDPIALPAEGGTASGRQFQALGLNAGEQRPLVGRDEAASAPSLTLALENNPLKPVSPDGQLGPQLLDRSYTDATPRLDVGHTAV